MESKKDKFVRIAEARTNKIIDMIKKIGKRYKNHKLTNTREIYKNENNEIVTRAQK